MRGGAKLCDEAASEKPGKEERHRSKTWSAVLDEFLKWYNDYRGAELVYSSPEGEEVRGGRPRLEGHRISVLDVTKLRGAGYSVSETADHLGITPDELRPASWYFLRLREEIAELQRRRREKHKELLRLT